MSILDDLEKLEREATPGPWTWGDGWLVADAIGSVYSNDRENPEIEKYMDMGLAGSNKPVIPLRIDHYEMIYDGDPVTPADRALIAAMRNALPKLLAVVRAAEGHRHDPGAGALDDALRALEGG